MKALRRLDEGAVAVNTERLASPRDAVGPLVTLARCCTPVLRVGEAARHAAAARGMSFSATIRTRPTTNSTFAMLSFSNLEAPCALCMTLSHVFKLTLGRAMVSSPSASVM